MINPDPSTILPATTVKRRFLELLAQLGGERSVVTITCNGMPAGILMSVEEYESLIETLEILADPKVARALRRARRGFSRGKTLRHDQVWPKD